MESMQDQKRKCRKRSHSINKNFSQNNKNRRLDRKRGQLGGSSSDPLNLEACPSNSRSSATPTLLNHHLGDQPAPLPEQLHSDPLNLEGKIENFESLVSELQQPPSLSSGGGSGRGNKKKKRPRKKSHSESSSSEVTGATSTPQYNPNGAIYRYGNYSQYYGYRNSESYWDDPRLKLLKKEWFQDKDVLDVGSNTGHLTITIGKHYCPLKITGIDIDTKLVRMAWKNLQRYNVPMVTPLGQPFPKSFMMSFALPVMNHEERGEGSRGKEFPNNVFFKQDNYVPSTDEDLHSIIPQYDVIMCLSVTKWVHLNWGDEGLKRMFVKMYRQLLPGGILILEPQPWSSYAKRKKLTSTIYSNYQNIHFFPQHFTSFLLSPQVGFVKHSFIGTSDNKHPGFQRSIHVYTKASHTTVQATPIETQAPPTKSQATPIEVPPTTSCQSLVTHSVS